VADTADRPWAALGNRVAAELYGCVVLDDGVEDDAANETRFVWLAPAGTPAGPGGGPFKTSVLFYGEGARDPGWLVACLSEFATRHVNLTKIESRPRRRGLGSYMFIADLEGARDDPPVEAALDGLRGHCEDVRVLGSYPAA
jgi:prephenate dehydratase